MICVVAVIQYVCQFSYHLFDKIRSFQGHCNFSQTLIDMKKTMMKYYTPILTDKARRDREREKLKLQFKKQEIT